MKATEQLIHEHVAITRMLDILDEACDRLESGATLPRTDLEEMVEFFVVFADSCHHAKEERHLFPALEEAGVPREHGPIGVMLAEHDLGRKFIRTMKGALEHWQSGTSRTDFITAAREYRRLLLLHIQKENNILFPMADMHLSTEKQEQMLQSFDKLEEEEMGAGTHEKFHARLATLGVNYLPAGVHA